jgi:DNA-binding NarL/FixJ family response regulator
VAYDEQLVDRIRALAVGEPGLTEKKMFGGLALLHQAYSDAERRRHPTPQLTAQLTARHWEVLHLVAAGHTNTQIARRLGISEGTARTHLENIYRLLRVSSRTAAVTRAFADPTA